MLATGRSSELFTIKVVVVGGVGKTSLFEVIYIYISRHAEISSEKVN